MTGALDVRPAIVAGGSVVDQAEPAAERIPAWV